MKNLHYEKIGSFNPDDVDMNEELERWEKQWECECFLTQEYTNLNGEQRIDVLRYVGTE